MVTRRDFFRLTGAGAVSLAAVGAGFAGSAPKRTPQKPNIIYILADDMGMGDVQALGLRSKIPTPNLNRLVREGRHFTDAHSGSAVCTPTRYGLLTGRYCWRTRLKKGVLMGYCEEPLIEKGRMTVASFLKSQGYDTAMFGKWHLGAVYSSTDGKFPTPKTTDWAGPITGGPADCGFDVFQGTVTAPNLPPFTWTNGRHFEKPCTRQYTTGQRGIEGGRLGPGAADYEIIDFLPGLITRVNAYLKSRKDSDRPFFLYYPLPSPHTPIVPTKQFKGRSGVGLYGDWVMQTDDAVGQLMKTLDELGMAENTLLVFTSDNGCSPGPAHVNELEKKGHFTSHIYRGYKADIYEGGHRMPFIVRWPGRVPAGTACEEPICHTDLLATVADLTGGTLPDNAGEDSVSVLPAILGEAYTPPLREATVHHSIKGAFAIRQGRWKFCDCSVHAGWTGPATPWDPAKGRRPNVQLFDMVNDPTENHNLCQEYPQIVKRMKALLEKYKRNGRSVPHRR